MPEYGSPGNSVTRQLTAFNDGLVIPFGNAAWGLRQMRGVSVLGGMGAGTFNFIGSNNRIQTTAADNIATHRIAHVFPRKTTGLRVILPNWYMHSSQLGEKAVGNVLPITNCFFEYNGVATRVTFNGQNTVTIPDGGMVISDPIGIDIDVAGATGYVRVAYSLTIGEYFPGSVNSYINNTFSKALLADSANGTGTLATQSGFYLPTHVVGNTYPYDLPSVFVVGDSIAKGNGDIYTNHLGWVRRALNDQYSYFDYTIGGHRAREFNQLQYTKHGLKLMEGCHYMLYCLGFNDQKTVSLAQMQADAAAIWDMATRRGIRVIAVTIPPYTTDATGFWRTTTDQVKAGGGSPADTVRGQYNNWIRAAPAPLIGYVELADLLETSRDSGIWKVAGSASDSGTADGTSTISVMDDTDKAWTTNQWAGYCLIITGGTGAPQKTQILSNTATRITYGASLVTAPDATSTYEIRNDYTIDGSHPAPRGHILMAGALNTALLTMAI